MRSSCAPRSSLKRPAGRPFVRMKTNRGRAGSPARTQSRTIVMSSGRVPASNAIDARGLLAQATSRPSSSRAGGLQPSTKLLVARRSPAWISVIGPALSVAAKASTRSTATARAPVDALRRQPPAPRRQAARTTRARTGPPRSTADTYSDSAGVTSSAIRKKILLAFSLTRAPPQVRSPRAPMDRGDGLARPGPSTAGARGGGSERIFGLPPAVLKV